MMFSAGMGIGLVFYGAAEPLSHFAISTPNAEIGSADALADAFRFTFFHWGFHAWAVYALVGLSLAYFGFRKREKYQLSVVFKPLFGKYADGPIATIIDTITIIATVIGVATTLGFGACTNQWWSLLMSLVFLIIVLCKSSLSSLRQFFFLFLPYQV